MLVLVAMSTADSPRERKLLDFGWRFHLGNAADITKDFGFGGGQTFAKAGSGPGPIQPNYDDGAWRSVNLPHDWVVEEDFVHNDDGLYVQHGSKPTGRKFPDFAVGWYRRTFNIPAGDKGKRLSVEFDGVFRDSLVWLNGHLLGRHASGYSSFAYDMTDFVNYGGPNVLTVRCDASQYEGWFYEGAGIYRHVWLVKSSAVHIARNGVYVTSVIDGQSATLTVHTTVVNDSDQKQTFHVGQTVLRPDGSFQSGAEDPNIGLEPWSSREVQSSVTVDGATLWSLENPYLYTLLTSVYVDKNNVYDQVPTTFGLRTIHFDKDQGFFLNGKRVEIKGTCNHQDHAGVGSALPDRLQYYRIEQLKKMGCNAIRTSHNPTTPELLDACDRLGMLVMDENRLLSSSEQGLNELDSLVMRDRNHPSVILWSIGNEEPEQGTPIGAQIAHTMVRRVHDLDPTRPVTYAGNNGTEYNGINSQVDVRGVNYITLGSPDDYHKAHPDQPMFGSEEASTLSTRGEYANDPVRGYMSAYDVNKPGWGTTAEEWWSYYAQRPWLAGAFVWTGFDYRGEPTPYGWPCISSHFGIMDTCGFPKDIFYYYQAWWTDDQVLHIFPHWNWAGKEGQPIEVWCFSNQQEVDLSLNGISLGRKKVPVNGHVSWTVPYVAGTLEAKGYNNGKIAVESQVKTTGDPARILLMPDRSTIDADGEDISVINVAVVDKDGFVVPTAANDISFDVDGGTILGVGNGDPSSHERDRFVESVLTDQLTAWQMIHVKSERDRVIFADKWPNATDVQLNGDARGLSENSFAAYRTTFDVTTPMQRGKLKLSVGPIDDFGWIYVNGKRVGETNDWDRTYSFDISRAVSKGKNEVIIVAKNEGGPGGLASVSLNYVRPAEPWHRSVFHGWAQVIVQGLPKPGHMFLHAEAKGLPGVACEIKTQKAAFRGYEEP